MVYTTAKLLLDGNGDPMPQFLDVTDTTDSPEGTFKPLTKIQTVEGTVGVNNFPTTQDVSDASLQTKIDDITNGTTPAATSLTGRNVEQAIARQVAQSTVTTTVNIPENARYALVISLTHAATGTFGTGEGFNLDTNLYDPLGGQPPALISPKYVGVGRTWHVYQPGGQINDLTHNLRDLKTSGFFVGTEMQITADITGTFASGEGIDFEAKVIFGI
jgi:hypothetical protein